MTPQPDNLPTIFLQGERVYVRPLESSDVRRAQRWVNDPETRVPLGSLFRPMSEDAEREFIESTAKDENAVHLAIVLRDGDRHIGVMGLHELNWKDRRATFGIFIGEKDCRGRGYGTEATQLMLQHAFRSLNLHRVELTVYAFNKQAIRSYEKAGFVHEGTKREDAFVDGRYVDSLLYAILATEYFAKP